MHVRKDTKAPIRPAAASLVNRNLQPTLTLKKRLAEEVMDNATLKEMLTKNF